MAIFCLDYPPYLVRINGYALHGLLAILSRTKTSVHQPAKPDTLVTNDLEPGQSMPIYFDT